MSQKNAIFLLSALVKDTAFFYGILYNFLRLFSTGAIFLYLTKQASTHEFIVYGILTVLTNFTSILDFGLAASFGRHISHSHSKNDVSKINEILNFSNKLYRHVSIIFILLSLNYLYFIGYDIVKPMTAIESVSILLYIFSAFINLRTLHFESYLAGTNQITFLKRQLIYGTLVQFVTFIILTLSSNNTILSISISNLLGACIARIPLRKRIPSNLIKVNSSTFDYKSFIWQNLKIGTAGILAFLSSKFFLTIGAKFLPPSDIAQLILLFGLLGIIETLALTYGTIKLPMLVSNIESNNQVEIRHITNMSLRIHNIVFLFGFILLFLFKYLNDVYTITNHKIQMSVLIFAFFYRYIDSNTSLLGLLSTAWNKVVFFRRSIISGILSVSILSITTPMAKNTILIIIVPALVQLFTQKIFLKKHIVGKINTNH